jgi:hypothetical protein
VATGLVVTGRWKEFCIGLKYEIRLPRAHHEDCCVADLLGNMANRIVLSALRLTKYHLEGKLTNET